MEKFAEEFWLEIQGLDKEEIMTRIENLIEDVYEDGYSQGYADAEADMPGSTSEN